MIRYGFPLRFGQPARRLLKRYLASIDETAIERSPTSSAARCSATLIAELRPELDLYLVTDVAVEEIAGSVTQNFQRIFYRRRTTSSCT